MAKQKTASAALLEKPVEAAVSTETVETVTEAGEAEAINIETMSADELDALATEYELETPENWATLDVEDKRAFIRTQGEDTGEETTEEVADAPYSPEAATEAPSTAPVAEVAPAEPAKKGKGRPKGSKNAKTIGATERKEAPKTESVPATETVADIVDPNVEAKAEGVLDTVKAPKGVTKTKGKSVVPSDDEIAQAVMDITNLKKEDAFKAALTLPETSDTAMFRFGGAVSVIQQNEWYRPDYPNLRAYIEDKLGQNYRRAMYYVQIYNVLASAGIPWSKFKGIGWSKVKEIIGVIKAENVDGWVKIAQTQTVNQLIETVRTHKANQLTGEGGDKEAKEVTTLSFKVHKGQKEIINNAVEVAKKVFGTDVAAVALEGICGEYVTKPGLEAHMLAAGAENVLKIFEKMFPDIEVQASLNSVS